MPKYFRKSFEHDAETQIASAIVGRGTPDAGGGSASLHGAGPATTTLDAGIAGSRADRIGLTGLGIAAGHVPVRAPFPNVAVHVVQSKRVWNF